MLSLKKNCYLIIPIIIIAIWAFIAILKRLPLDHRGIFISDFGYYYQYSLRWFAEPDKIYETRYYYHPFTLVFFFLFYGFLPLFYAHWLNMILNFVFYSLLMIEADKLLKFANLNKFLHRLIILIVCFNGWHIYMNFFYNTFKPFVAFVIIFLLRREIQFNQEDRKKSLFYYFINYYLFFLILCISPYLVYFFIIFFFYDIPLKDLFKKKYLGRYIMLLIVLISQNYLFLIYPNLIEGFLSGLLFPSESLGEPYFFYLFLPTFVSISMRTTLTLIIVIFLLIMAIIITIMPKLNLQQKFSYYALFHFTFSPFRNYYFLALLLPLVMIIYIPFLKENDNFFTFIKKNILIVIGCCAIAIYLLYIDYFSGIFAASLVFIFVMSLILLHYFNMELTKEIFFG